MNVYVMNRCGCLEATLRGRKMNTYSHMRSQEKANKSRTHCAAGDISESPEALSYATDGSSVPEVAGRP